MTTGLVDLAARLRRDGPAVSARVMDEMWRDDPFWEKRFGEGGRQRMSEDAAFHVQYLVQAVEAADGGVMKRYATWLQSVLTTRGMSTRHLDDNFARLAKAVAHEIPGSETAVEYLAGACEALRHPSGPARELVDAIPRLTKSDDVAYVVAHLADAIALARPEIFAAHAKFLSQNGAGDSLRDALGAIEADAGLSPEAKKAVRAATT